MRAFLREPSTPWIVFDREGRPPSQLAVGEVLPVAYSSVIPDHGFFPATAVIDAVASQIAASRVEPSSLAVASDLNDDGGHGRDRALDFIDPAAGDGASPILVFGLTRRVIGAAAAAVAIVSTLALGAFALHASSYSLVTSSPGDAPHTQSMAAHGSPVPADLAPPDLDPRAAAKPVSASPISASPISASPVSASPVSASPVPAPSTHAPPVMTIAPGVSAPVSGSETPAKAAAKKYARLSVVGEARSRDVFLDGKRMLGKGARSFTVLCGTHTVAVGERSNSREVEIPCTGIAELVVSN